MQQNNLASISKRVISFTIDDLIISILFVIIFYKQIITLHTPEDMAIFIQNTAWVIMLLRLLYHTFFIGLNGATIGKYFAKIKAVDINSGNTLSWYMAFIRAVVREIGEMFFYFTFFFAFFDKNRQTLHDKISNCVVVNA